MRSLRLLLAVGLGLAPTLAAPAAAPTPAFAGGGACMTLTATMDGQDQRLLAGTKHTVHITVTNPPCEADLRDITISLADVAVDCPAGMNGQLSLEPTQSLQCTAVVTAAVGPHTLVVQATADVPGGGSLQRTAPVHYIGFIPPPPPPPPTPVAAAPVPPQPPRPPDSPSGQSGQPVAAPVPPPLETPIPVPANPPGLPPAGPGAPVGAAGPGAPVAGACPGAAAGSTMTGGCCDSDHQATMGSKGCCASADKSGPCAKHEGLAFTGMSAPMLTGVGAGGLLLVAGGLLLVRKSARR